MFVWPVFGLSYAIFQLGKPVATIDVGMLAWVGAFVIVPLLALAVSGRRYLR